MSVVSTIKPKTYNEFWKFSTYYIAFIIINGRPTSYMRHKCYTHKHQRVPYAPMSALQSLRIFEDIIILVDYFAVFVKM